MEMCRVRQIFSPHNYCVDLQSAYKVKNNHVPLLHRADGTLINGLKRCADCGLSETYWQRWPVCSRFAVQLKRADKLCHAVRYVAEQFRLSFTREQAQANIEARTILLNAENAVLNEAEGFIPKGPKAA